MAYLNAFGLLPAITLAGQTMVEIGCGIGRMTASFSRMFAKVIACDLDAAFLERCRETVAQFGRPERLQTSHVADGRTLALPDDSADLVFSYITLQHCHHDDALALAREAVRVTKPGGHIALNFRTWVAQDIGVVARRQDRPCLVATAHDRPGNRPAPAPRPASAGRPTGCRRRRC